jgi:hypothetical protein
MANRRSLIEGVEAASDVAASLEEAFVFGGDKSKSSKPTAVPTAAQVQVREGKGLAATTIGRVPLTTRMRADYSEALKRASLERQLQKVSPNTLQDILEEAVEPWLRTHGYLS